MAPKYHGEDDTESSSIFPSESVHLEHTGVCEDGDRGRNSWTSPRASWERADPARIWHRARSTERGLLSQQLCSCVSSLIPTWDWGSTEIPLLSSALRNQGMFFLLHHAPSLNPCLLRNQKVFPSFCPQQIKENKFARKQTCRAWLHLPLMLVLLFSR